MDRITIKKIKDENSILSVFEKLPFEVKRVYTIHNLKHKDIRGEHAHYKTDQVLLCIKGDCIIDIFDKNFKESIHLGVDCDGYILWHQYWHKVYSFSNDCVLLVLASEKYDKKDYIRDYELYKRTIFTA